MRLLRIALIIGLAAGLMVGCSEKKKDAAKLEQELKELEAGADTGQVTAEDSLMESVPVADASAVPEEEEPGIGHMPPVPEGEGYTVQVASCEDAEYARYLVEKFDQRGYETFVQTVTFNGQTYYRVRIGNLGTYAEAKGLKLELVDRYSLDPWIDRINR